MLDSCLNLYGLVVARDISTGLPHPRDEEVEAEEEYQQHHELPRSAPPVTERASAKLPSLFRIPVWATVEWTSLMLFRMRLSRAIHHLKHSRHLRYALKNGIGVLLLSLPAFLPYNSQGGHPLYPILVLNYIIFAIPQVAVGSGSIMANG